MNIYAFRNKKEIERKSSSGGAFTAIVEAAFNIFGEGCRDNLTVYGAMFDDDLNVVHAAAKDLTSCQAFRGSKYVESNIIGCYSKIGEALRDGNVVLFSGTPCQVSAIKHYLKQKNINTEYFFTVDVLCHGTPSRRLWNDYKEWLEKKNKSKPIEFSFRYKDARWRLYPCMAKFTDGRVRVNTQDVRLFTTLFFTNLTYRECCYHCQYASLKREGDITLGDFWGFEDVMPAIAQKWNIKASQGVSLVMIHSDKGKLLWDEVIKNEDAVLCEPCLSEKYVKYQHNLSSPTEKPVLADKFKEDYKKYGFDYVIKKYANYNFRGKIRFALSRFYHERISKS